jgi:hypothetical protein
MIVHSILDRARVRELSSWVLFRDFVKYKGPSPPTILLGSLYTLIYSLDHA